MHLGDLCTDRFLIANNFGGWRNCGLNLIMAGLLEENLIDTVVTLFRYEPAWGFVHQTGKETDRNYISWQLHLLS